MAIADLISNLFGTSPTAAVMQAAQATPQQQVAPPVGGGVPPAAAVGGAAMGTAPAQQDPTAAPAPAPSMVELYAKMMKDAEARKQIDSGLTLIAAGFAQPENRNALIQMAANGGGSGGDSSPSKAFEMMMKIQGMQDARVQRAAHLANLPGIAKRLGINIDDARLLYDSGKLGDVLQTNNSPTNYEVVKGADGTQYRLDKTRGDRTIISGPSDGSEDNQIVQYPDGRAELINKRSGNKVSTLSDGNGQPTSDMKEWEAVKADNKARGLPEPSLQDFLSQSQKAKAQVINLGNTAGSALAKGYVDQHIKDAERARESINVINVTSNARDQIERLDGVIAGSKLSNLELEGRKIIGDIFGLKDDKVTNTQTFLSSMKEMVLPKVKALGSGTSISNADVKFIEEAVGGSIEMDVNAIKRLMTISERMERAKILDYNIRSNGLRDRMPEAKDFVTDVEMPPPSKYLLSAIPPDAIKRLRENDTPASRKEFDRHFGMGLSAYLLQGAQ